MIITWKQLKKKDLAIRFKRKPFSYSPCIVACFLTIRTCHISDLKKNATGRRRPKTYQAYDPTNCCTDTYLWSFCHTRGASSATRISTKRCRYPPPFCRQPAACSTPCLHANPAAAVTRVHDVSVLTRSHLSRCIRPVKGLRCGLRRRPCALRFSPGFCGGTAQEGAGC